VAEKIEYTPTGLGRKDFALKEKHESELLLKSRKTFTPVCGVCLSWDYKARKVRADEEYAKGMKFIKIHEKTYDTKLGAKSVEDHIYECPRGHTCNYPWTPEEIARMKEAKKYPVMA